MGLVAAVEQDNLERAAEYLESRLRLAERRELAQKLGVVVNRRLSTSLGRLSDSPDGDLGDGLTNRDRIGLVESQSGSIEMFVDRVPSGQGGAIWVFSSSILEEIPRLYDEVQPPWIEQYVPDWLLTTGWLGLPFYRWIALLLFVPLVYGVAAPLTRGLTALLGPLARRLGRPKDERLMTSTGPIRLLVLGLLCYSGSFLGFTFATRYFWNSVAVTLMIMALCWIMLRLLDLLADASLRRVELANRAGDTALVRLITRLSKAATVIVAGLVLLYLAEVDLTAALTGLGVGGLAIGFGAQKRSRTCSAAS